MSPQLWSSAPPVAFNLECSRHTQRYKIQTNKYISSKKNSYSQREYPVEDITTNNATVQILTNIWPLMPVCENSTSLTSFLQSHTLKDMVTFLLMMHHIYTYSKAIRARPQSALHSRKSKPLNIKTNEKHHLQDSIVQL